jgi:hypothetical protein
MMLCQLFLIPYVHAYAFARKLGVHVASAPPTGGGRGPGTSAAIESDILRRDICFRNRLTPASKPVLLNASGDLQTDMRAFV